MTVFELIKLVLDDEYTAIAGTNAAKDASVNAELAALQAAYADLANVTATSPGYSSAARRFAYIYKYTTCHANIVAEKIAEVPELTALFSGEGWVDVACIGGGPGSDFLGIIKHMIRNRSTSNLKTYLLDKEPAWGDSWADVERRAADFDFQVFTHAQVLDVLVPNTWTAQTRYRRADLFTFVYFISEVWRLSAKAAPYFANLFQAAKPGSLLLFIDNNSSQFYDHFDTLATTAGLQRVAGGEEKFQMEYSEEKTDLEPYYSKLVHKPKIQSNIAWRVYRKPVP